MVNKLIIPKHNYTEREKTVLDILYKYDGKIDSFINIGFHDWDDPRRHWWIKVCHENKIEWNILEIFSNNVKNAILKGCPERNIKQGSILDVDCYDTVDCLMFWHGPEHIDKIEFLNALPKIEKKVKKLIIFGMPYGKEDQGAAYGNKWERHISSWTEQDWVNLGYKYIVVNDRKIGHITTYKEK